MEDDKQQQIHLLRTMLAPHVKRMNEAATVINGVVPIISALNAAIKALEQKPSVTDSLSPIPPDNKVQMVSTAAPARKHEYAGLTHIDAAKMALTKLVKPGETTHVDNIVREAYMPFTDNDVFYRVKRIVVSEIIRAMKKHVFVRGSKPNTFGLPKQEGLRMAS